MDELIRQAAEQLGYPEGMVERSAQARAQAEGTSVEAVLTAWLGGEAPPAAAAPPAAEPAAAAPPAAPAPAAEPRTEPAPATPAVEVLGPEEAADEPAAEAPAEPPQPEEPEGEEPVAEPAGAVPRWLAAAFVLVPLIAVLYALFVPNGPDCGSGGVLAIDPATGAAVNCDGSAYGSDEVDFFRLGQSTYAECSACHGVGGAGGGSFPALSGGAVLATFPVGQCEAHVEWVKLGTLNWPEPTYGANQTPVGGSGAQMPGFENALSDEEVRAVVLYERVAFGGGDLAEAETDCGLTGEAVAAGE